jgi:antitoxin (DNA-binding transcriptional repressor) of toxin-antitoxin stability system
VITLSLTDASRQFLDLVKRVCVGEEAVLLDHGKPVVLMVPAGMTAKPVTGASLAASWSSLPALGAAEAEEFENDLASARSNLPKASSPWE